MTVEEIDNYIEKCIKETFPDEVICHTVEEVNEQPYDIPFWWVDDISITYYKKLITKPQGAFVYKFHHKEPKFKTKTEIIRIINEIRQCFYETYYDKGDKNG